MSCKKAAIPRSCSSASCKPMALPSSSETTVTLTGCMDDLSPAASDSRRMEDSPWSSISDDKAADHGLAMLGRLLGLGRASAPVSCGTAAPIRQNGARTPPGCAPAGPSARALVALFGAHAVPPARARPQCVRLERSARAAASSLRDRGHSWTESSGPAPDPDSGWSRSACCEMILKLPVGNGCASQPTSSSTNMPMRRNLTIYHVDAIVFAHSSAILLRFTLPTLP